MHLPRVHVPDGWAPWLIVGGTILVTHWVDERVNDLEQAAKVWAVSTPDGTPMREVVPPAAAWVIGASPFPPTPAERHAPMETANPAPEGATTAEIREEWRAHKAVARAIEKGTLIRPGPHNRRAANYEEAHHPDYAEPLRIRWETRKEHAGMRHRY